MKRSYFIAAIAAAAAGTALHFLYEVSPNLISALLSSVNESVWEHLKLLYSTHALCRIRLWSGFLTALLAMPLFLLGLHYGLRLLGVSGTAVDIVLYYLTMFAGFWLAWRLQRSGRLQKHTGLLLMLVILYGASLILFTFAAPPLPIFTPPEKTAYPKRTAKRSPNKKK